MYKKILFVVTILSIIAMVFGTAATAVSGEAKEKSVRLIRVDYQKEKGVVLKFRVDGSFNDSELKGFILADGKSLTLYCPRKDPSGVVICTAQKATAQLAGKHAYVLFAGFTFSFIIPKRPR